MMIDVWRKSLVLIMFAVGMCLPVFAGGGHMLLHQGDVPYTITVPGAYTLVSDLASTNTPAIVVEASDVFIDLNGYRVSNNGTIIISQAAGHHRLTIRNGRIGVTGQNSWWGIFAPGMGNRFEDLILREATTAAIESGPGTIVRGCTFASNPLNDASFSALSLGPGSLVVDSRFSDNGSSGIAATVLKVGDGSIVHGAHISGTRGSANTSLVSAGPGSVIGALHSRSQSGAATNGLITSAGPVVLSGGQIAERLVLPQGGVVVDSHFSGAFTNNAATRHAFGPHTVLHQSTFAGSSSNAGALLAHQVQWTTPPTFGGNSLVRSSIVAAGPAAITGEGTYMKDSSIYLLDIAGNRHRVDGNHFHFDTQWNSNMVANADVLWVRNHRGVSTIPPFTSPGPNLSVTNIGHIPTSGVLNPWSNRP